MENRDDKKRRTFRKFVYRGVEFDQLLEMPIEDFSTLLRSAERRRLRRGLEKREIAFLKRCEKAKRENVGAEEKPSCVATHSRSMVILPQLVGNIVGVYNGKDYVQFEIKPEMIGLRLGDFSSTHKHVKHGKPGIGATSSSKFVPLK
jgi:small subunit ribosomal protein S15e